MSMSKLLSVEPSTVLLAEIQFSQREKPTVSTYLRKTFPDSFMRRVLDGTSDSTIFAQIPIDANFRDSINNAVLALDATPFLIASRTRVAQRVLQVSDEPGDVPVAWAHFNGAEAGAVIGLFSELQKIHESGNLTVLDVCKTIGPRQEVYVRFAYSTITALDESVTRFQSLVAANFGLARVLI